MRHLRCKCGESTIMTSMGSPNCSGCEKCDTTYAYHPDMHYELELHEWKTIYNQQTGKSFKVCKKCSKKDKNSYDKSLI